MMSLSSCSAHSDLNPKADPMIIGSNVKDTEISVVIDDLASDIDNKYIFAAGWTKDPDLLGHSTKKLTDKMTLFVGRF